MRTLCAVGNFESIVKKGNNRSRDTYEKTDHQKTIPSNQEIIHIKTKSNTLVIDYLDEAQESIKY